MDTQRNRYKSFTITSCFGVIITAVFIGVLGALPHIFHSINVGTIAYLKGAWDEDFYILWILRGDWEVYRYFGSWVVNCLYQLTGGDVSNTLIGIDIIVPMMLAFITGYIVYHCGFREFKSQFLAIVLLLFAYTLLAGTNRSFLFKLVGLTPWGHSNIPDYLRMYLPNLMTTFFQIYKSPDPQISLLAHFAFCAGLLRYMQSQYKGWLFFLFIVCLLLPYVYICVSVPLLIFAAGYCVCNILWNYNIKYYYFLGAVVFFAAYLASYFVFGYHNEFRMSFIFPSRLPIFTPSIIWGIAGISFIVLHNKDQILKLFSKSNIKQNHLLALCCFSMPIVLLNQQFITGYMIRSQSWEYATNYQYIAFGILLVWPEIRKSLFLRIPISWEGRMVAITFGMVVTLLVVGQFTVFHRYEERNLYAEASAYLIKKVQSEGDSRFDNIVLNKPNNDSAVKLKLNQPDMTILSGREQIFSEYRPSISSVMSEYQFLKMPFKQHGFTLFDRQEITPENLKVGMTKNLDRGLCMPYLIYFFTLGDCWYPLTDYRNVKTDDMKKYIGDIVLEYEDFQKNAKQRTGFGNILYISDKKLAVDHGLPWNTKLIATKTLGKYQPLTIYAYAQNLNTEQE